MIHTEALLPGLIFGLANSAHCAGMCGAFALRAGTHERPAWSMASYLSGKTFTYSFIGALAGLAGAAVLPDVVGAQAAIGIAVGLALILTGFRILFPGRRKIGTTPVGALVGRVFSPVFGAAARATRTGGSFTLGALTGFLPCGIVYLAAAQGGALGSPAHGATFMVAFGLGTMPVLLGVGLAGRTVIARMGAARVRVVGGVIVVLAGTVGIWRASLPLLTEGPAGSVPCCH